MLHSVLLLYVDNMNIQVKMENEGTKKMTREDALRRLEDARRLKREYVKELEKKMKEADETDRESGYVVLPDEIEGKTISWHYAKDMRSVGIFVLGIVAAALMLVLEGLIYILTERLQAGTVVSMGNFGNFRMVAGSVGASTEEEFNTSMFKKPRIIFKPGILLREVNNNAKFEKLPTVTVTVTEQCDKEHVY